MPRNLDEFSKTIPKFNRIEKTPAYKKISDVLQKAIVQRHIKVGDALPTEGKLADQFGVNRSTVREGIRHMEQIGFVRRQGKKLIVSRPSSALVGDQMSQVLMLQDVTFLELWEVKMGLEPLAAELAATKITDNLIDRLQANMDAMEIALATNGDVVALDVEFHALVAEAADNKALLMAREAVARLFYPAYQASMLNDTAGQRLLSAHGFIMDAIRNRDPETARLWMKKHIVDFKRGHELAGRDVNKPVTDIVLEDILALWSRPLTMPE